MRSSDPRQLGLVFADSPQGGGVERGGGVSAAREALLLRAGPKTTKRSDAWAADQDRLLEAAACERNLARALLKVVRNEGAPGVDGQTVEEAEADAPRLLAELRRSLLDGSYRPGAIRRVLIDKPDGGQRPLGIPNVRDRVVQQALLQVLEPVFEPHFHPSSHGFRPGRGAHTAIVEAKRHLAAERLVLVDLDISKFFERVHHQRLLDRMGQRVRDRRVLAVVRRMLEAKVQLPDGSHLVTWEGTPQGGPLSPLLSNIVLDELDWELERRGHRFVRYADDCNVFVRSERAGQRVMASLRRFLEGRLRLHLNPEKSAVTRPEAARFLGFRFVVASDGGVEVHLSAKARKRLDATIRKLTPRNWGQSLQSCIEQANEYLAGWISHYQLCTEEGAALLARFDAHIRRRLRAIVIRQRKRPRYLLRHLVARGAHPRTAKLAAYCGRGLWYRSNHPGVTRAYPNAWFHGRLVSLAERWQDLNPVRQVSPQLSLDL